MGQLLLYVDTILVTLSLFLALGYHGVLWHSFKTKPHLTTMGVDKIRMRMWVLGIIQDTNDKKLMLAVQSLRNSLMSTILIATIAVILNSSLAAITNNTYKASHLLKDSSFATQTAGWTICLKYGSTSLLLLVSFVCNSMALGWLNEANFLANVSESILHGRPFIQVLMDRGFLFAFIGHRMLCLSIPLMLWLFGPVPMALSSLAMVWVFHGLDFKNELHNSGMQDLLNDNLTTVKREPQLQ